MRILALADENFIGEFLPRIRSKTGRVDIILSCGDVSYATLCELLKIKGNIPTFGVHGNHDEYEFPEGIENLHLKQVEYKGLKLGGFEGSWRYKPDGTYLYTDEEVLRLMGSFPYVDIFLAHTNPKGIHDKKDSRVGYGFVAFREYIERVQQKIFLHGHVHENLETNLGKTKIISVYGQRIIRV